LSSIFATHFPELFINRYYHLSPRGNIMESVYYYEDAKNKEVLTILEDDFFKRIGYTVRECKLMGSQRKGSFLYIKGSPEDTGRAEKMLAGLKLLKLAGEENKIIIAAFVAEEESAASGMGMIFG
jgi:hypothetical protein